MLQIINKTIAVSCYLPYLYLMLYYSFVVRAIMKLGKIPFYNNPDPKMLGFNIHRELIYRTFDFIAIGIIANLILIGITLVLKRFTLKRKHWLFFLAGILLIFYFLSVDPFAEWFAD